MVQGPNHNHATVGGSAEHNDKKSASIDFYSVDDYTAPAGITLPIRSPGGRWALHDPYTGAGYITTEQALSRYQEANGGKSVVVQSGVYLPSATAYVCHTITEVEAAVIVSPTRSLTVSVPTGASNQDFGQNGVDMEFGSNTEGGDATVVRIIGTPPGCPTNTLPYYWAISGLENSAFLVVLGFSYSDPDVSGLGLDENSLRLIRSTDSGQTWSPVDSSRDTGVNHLSASNPQSSFSLWGILGDKEPTKLDEWSLY